MKIKLLFPILVFSCFLTGCSIVEQWLPESTPAPSGTTLFSDDFSNPQGWGTQGRTGGSVDFVYEGMKITVDTPNYLFWTVNGQKFQDAIIDVDAVLLNGSTNDNFGILCRFQDNEHFYGFVVSHDGYYGIFKMKDGIVEPLLKPDAMQYSDKIRQGGVVNHLQVICDGNALTLKVNGEKLTSIGDLDYQTGKIGLIAGAYDQADIELFFDNLVVTQP